MKRSSALLLLGLITLTGCGPATSGDSSPDAGAPAPAPAAAEDGPVASSVLDTLAVKGRAPKTGYTRDQFGQSWADDNDVELGRNGCDTRNDILQRDLTQITYRSGDCVVATGVLNDPYSAKSIQWQRGEDTSSAVQIDHVVALSDAWQKGAQQLSIEQRINLANDPRNLLAADGPLNSQKGDSDAATWLPPNKSFRCAYVARQIGVKSLYQLWVTQAEKDAMSTVLGSCPQERIPFALKGVDTAQPSASTPVVTPETQTPSSTPVAPVPTAPVADDSGLSAPPAPQDSYASCAEAKAAGAAPVRTGDPGYSTKLDRDGDGIGCEG